MVNAVILAGLLIGSAMFIIRDVGPKWLGIPLYAIGDITAPVLLGLGMLTICDKETMTTGLVGLTIDFEYYSEILDNRSNK